MVNTLVTVCGQFVPVPWHFHCGQNNVLMSFYCWMSFPDCIRYGPMFPIWILQQVPSLVCHVWLGIIMAENYTVAKQRQTVSPDSLLQVFSVAQYPSKLTLCIHSRKFAATLVISPRKQWPALCQQIVPHAAVTHLSVWTSSLTHAIATSIIIHFGYCLSRCPCQMRMLRHHLATFCLDIKSFTYTSISCQWISAADIFWAHQTRVTPLTTKQDQWWITMLNCHSCAPRHLPRIMTTNATPLWHMYQQHVKFQRDWCLK
jgi:hypothetical protein